MPAELANIPRPPADLMYLWCWTCSMYCPLTFSEISHWASLTGKTLAYWEVEAMMSLDRIRNV